MIKPKMTLWERYKVRKNIKRITSENTYYREFCKRQFHHIHKFNINAAPKSLIDLCTCKKIFLDKSYKIYILCNTYDISEIILAYNDEMNKLIILDDRINNKLLDLAIAIVESRIGIKRLIDKDFLK